MRLTGLKSIIFASTIAIGLGTAVFAATQGQQGQAQGQGQGQAGQAGAPGRGGQAPPPQNLQVLPKDMTRQQLTPLMRSFAAALGGVECTHCHIGGQQDRAKDDNPKKAIARKMIQMTDAINKEMLKGIGDPPAEGAAKVTCYTCHRGALKPLTVPAGGGH